MYLNLFLSIYLSIYLSISSTSDLFVTLRSVRDESKVYVSRKFHSLEYTRIEYANEKGNTSSNINTKREKQTKTDA